MPLEIYEIDINREYLIDEDHQVFTSCDHWEECEFDSINGDGGTKGAFESNSEDYYERRQVSEISGKGAIVIMYRDLLKDIEYRDRKWKEELIINEELREEIERLKGE